LCDFIVHSDGEEEEGGECKLNTDEPELSGAEEAAQLQASLGWNVNEFGSRVENGRRRSTRQRTSVQRYQDPHFMRLMTDDVDLALLQEEEDDSSYNPDDDSDMEMDVADCESSDYDSDDDDDDE
jgi:hypothetical protein